MKNMTVTQSFNHYLNNIKYYEGNKSLWLEVYRSDRKFPKTDVKCFVRGCELDHDEVLRKLDDANGVWLRSSCIDFDYGIEPEEVLLVAAAYGIKIDFLENFMNLNFVNRIDLHDAT